MSVHPVGSRTFTWPWPRHEHCTDRDHDHGNDLAHDHELAHDHDLDHDHDLAHDHDLTHDHDLDNWTRSDHEIVETSGNYTHLVATGSHGTASGAQRGIYCRAAHWPTGRLHVWSRWHSVCFIISGGAVLGSPLARTEHFTIFCKTMFVAGLNSTNHIFSLYKST